MRACVLKGQHGCCVIKKSYANMNCRESNQKECRVIEHNEKKKMMRAEAKKCVGCSAKGTRSEHVESGE